MSKVLSSVLLYTIIAGIFAAVITMAAKSKGGEFKKRAGLLTSMGAVLGCLSAFVYIYTYLTDLGFAYLPFDPGRYLGYFHLDPIKPVASEYGWSRAYATLHACPTIAVGFLVVLVVFTTVISSSAKDGLVVGLIGGAVFVVLGFFWGTVYDVTGSSYIMTLPAAIISIAGYVIPAYLWWRL